MSKPNFSIRFEEFRLECEKRQQEFEQKLITITKDTLLAAEENFHSTYSPRIQELESRCANNKSLQKTLNNMNIEGLNEKISRLETVDSLDFKLNEIDAAGETLAEIYADIETQNEQLTKKFANLMDNHIQKFSRNHEELMKKYEKEFKGDYRENRPPREKNIN